MAGGRKQRTIDEAFFIRKYGYMPEQHQKFIRSVMDGTTRQAFSRGEMRKVIGKDLLDQCVDRALRIIKTNGWVGFSKAEILRELKVTDKSKRCQPVVDALRDNLCDDLLARDALLASNVTLLDMCLDDIFQEELKKTRDKVKKATLSDWVKGKGLEGRSPNWNPTEDLTPADKPEGSTTKKHRVTKKNTTTSTNPNPDKEAPVSNEKSAIPPCPYGKANLDSLYSKLWDWETQGEDFNLEEIQDELAKAEVVAMLDQDLLKEFFIWWDANKVQIMTQNDVEMAKDLVEDSFASEKVAGDKDIDEQSRASEKFQTLTTTTLGLRQHPNWLNKASTWDLSQMHIHVFLPTEQVQYVQFSNMEIFPSGHGGEASFDKLRAVLQDEHRFSVTYDDTPKGYELIAYSDVGAVTVIHNARTLKNAMVVARSMGYLIAILWIRKSRKRMPIAEEMTDTDQVSNKKPVPEVERNTQEEIHTWMRDMTSAADPNWVPRTEDIERENSISGNSDASSVNKRKRMEEEVSNQKETESSDIAENDKEQGSSGNNTEKAPPLKKRRRADSDIISTSSMDPETPDSNIPSMRNKKQNQRLIIPEPWPTKTFTTVIKSGALSVDREEGTDDPEEKAKRQDDEVESTSYSDEVDVEAQLTVGGKFMQSIIEASGLEQWDEEFWKNFCCPLVRHDPNVTERFVHDENGDIQLDDNEQPIETAGFRPKVNGLLMFPLQPHQLDGICWMMRHERKTWNGGILGDEMGLGKSFLSIGLVVIDGVLKRREVEVIRYRSNPDDETLPKHLLSGSEPADCPSEGPQLPGDLICPCVDSSLFTRNGFLPRRDMNLSPTLIIVPPFLLANWQAELKRFTPKGYLLIVVISSSDKTFYLPDLNAEMKKHRYPERVVFLATDSILFSKGGRQVFLDQVVKKITYQKGGRNKPKTSVDDWERHKFPPRQTRNTLDVKYWPKPINVITFARVIVDEAHRHRSKNNTLLDKLAAFNCPIWFLSGTPFDKGPQDMEQWLTVMRSNWTAEWSQDAETKAFNEEAVTRMRRISNQSNPSKNEKAQTIIKFGKLLGRTVLMRKGNTTRWGQPLIWIPDHSIKTIETSFLPNSKVHSEVRRYAEEALKAVQDLHQKAMTQWNNDPHKAKRAPPTALNTKALDLIRLQRIFVTLPTLRNFDREELKVEQFSQWANVCSQKGRPDSKDPFYKAVDAMVTESPKIRSLVQHLRKLAPNKDLNGRRVKGLIFTRWPIVGYCIYLILIRFKYPAAFYNANYSQKERDHLVEVFMRENNENFEPGDIQWMVGTMEMLGVGLNLTRGSVCFIMETDYTSSKERQAMKRISRTGQTIPTWCYKFVQSDLVIEQLVTAKSEAREAFIMETIRSLADDSPGGGYFSDGVPLLKDCDMDELIKRNKAYLKQGSNQKSSQDASKHKDIVMIEEDEDELYDRE